MLKPDAAGTFFRRKKATGQRPMADIEAMNAGFSVPRVAGRISGPLVVFHKAFYLGRRGLFEFALAKYDMGDFLKARKV